MMLRLSVELSPEDRHAIGGAIGISPPANYRQAREWLEKVIKDAIYQANLLYVEDY